MNKPSISMKGFPFTPLDPNWLVESSAFHSQNPKLVRAAVQLLFHAWAAEPAGSIPSDMRRIGVICGMSDIEVGEHYEALTEGWELRDGRLHHLHLSALCARLADRFGDTITQLADRAAAVVQAPEEFELVGTAIEPSRTKGRRLIPSTFGLTPTREAWLLSKGFVTQEDREFIMEKFIANAKGGNVKWNDWDEAFKNYALKENMRNIPSNRGGMAAAGVFTSRAARFGSTSHGTRGEASVDHNRAMMAAAGTRAEAPTP